MSNDSEVKKCSGDECGDKNTRHDTSDVSMPICFLVKEQAKSLIAIQVEYYIFSYLKFSVI